MGYYTNYTISYVAPSPVQFGYDDETLSNRISTLSGYDLVIGERSDDIKWYDHDEHMRLLSIEYPKLIFVLKGEGEESGDYWLKYYRNGKCQNAKITWTFDQFDENKLK